MKFAPTHPFRLYQTGTYQGKPSKTSEFLTELVRGQIETGGVPVRVYRYIGVPAQKKDALGLDQEIAGSGDIAGVGGIQDTILMETRDRLYDVRTIPVVPGVYQVSAFELEYLKYGASFANDALSMEFHVGTVEKELGRRFVEGDVVELPHLKDVTIDGRIQRRFYEVSKTTFSPGGYDPNWGRHILGVIIRPLKHQQEFIQILDERDEYGKTLAEQNSNLPTLLDITATNQEMAAEQVKTTGFDRSRLWMDPTRPERYRDLFADTINPPDGSVPIGQGEVFPAGVAEGSWFVRSDMEPKRLFRLVNGYWRVYAVDHKREWGVYNWPVGPRQFMSDRSTADRSRPYELRSIHDVLTDRELRSDPTSDESERKRLGFK